MALLTVVFQRQIYRNDILALANNSVLVYSVSVVYLIQSSLCSALAVDPSVE